MKHLFSTKKHLQQTNIFFQLSIFLSLSIFVSTSHASDSFADDFALQEKLNLNQLATQLAPLTKQSPSLAQDVDQARHNFLKDKLEKQDEYGRRWQYLWGAGYAGSLGRSLYGIERDDTKAKRIEHEVGALTSSLTLYTHFFKDNYPQLNASRTLFSNHAGTTQSLRSAEQILKQRAQFYTRMNSTKNKLLSYGVALLSSAVIANHSGDDKAIQNFALSAIGIEMGRRTLNRDMVDDWQEYQQRFGQQPYASVNTNIESKKYDTRWAVVPYVKEKEQGLLFHKVF